MRNVSKKSTRISIFAFAMFVAAAIFLSEVARADEVPANSPCPGDLGESGLFCRSDEECNALLLGEKDSTPYSPAVASLLETLIPLRYDVTTNGLDEVKRRGTKGILFVSNHEAPIDPLIMLSVLSSLQVRPVMTEELVMIPGLGKLIERAAGGVNAILIPAHKSGRRSTAKLIKELFAEMAEALNSGDNILLYPAGQVQRSANESIGATRGVHTILTQFPDVRVVMIRQRGLWGSSFSWGAPAVRTPKDAKTAKLILRGFTTGLITLAANGVFLAPKRDVRLEFLEAKDFPRYGTKEEMNAYMQSFFNDESDPEIRRKVPYHFLMGSKPVELQAVDYSNSQKLSGVEVVAPSFDPGI